MASSSSSSDDDTFNESKNVPDQNSAATVSLHQMSTEEALVYLDKKYSERFTSTDRVFTEALQRETIPPPIVPNFEGKQQLHGRRSGGGNFNNRRFDNNDYRGGGGGRRYDNDRRYDRDRNHQGGYRRYDNEGRGGGGRGSDYNRQYDRNERR